MTNWTEYMKGRTLLAALMLGLALTAEAHQEVDAVTGATQTAAQSNKQNRDDERVRKGMAKMRKALPRVHGVQVETAVTMQGHTMAKSSKWTAELLPAEKMKVEKTMSFPSARPGHSETLTYQFMRQAGSQLCAVRIKELCACIYFSAPADEAQNLASAVHQHVALPLEMASNGKNGKNK